MKDQNDDALDPIENTNPESADGHLDDFDQDDLSQFDDIQDDFEEGEEFPADATSDESDYAVEDEDEAYAALDEGASPVNSTKKGGGSLIDMVKENWLYAILGLIVIIVAGYLIMGVISPSSSAPRPAPAPATQGNFNTPSATAAPSSTAAPAATATSSTSTTTTAAPNSTAAGPVTNITMTSDQMQQLLTGFSNTVQQSMKSIQDSLQASGSPATNQKLAALQGQLSDLDGNIAQLDNNIAVANTRLSTTQAQLSQVLGQETADQQKLTLRAVVPGRAWLVDGKGNTISVTVGTALGNIGTVTEIDADNSQVVTSSGYVFK